MFQRKESLLHPFSLALDTGNYTLYEALHKLVKFSPAVRLFHVLSHPGNTEGRLKIVQSIFKPLSYKKANAVMRSRTRLSILGEACKNNHEKVVKFLLQSQKLKASNYINVGNPTPLWHATYLGDVGIVKELLNAPGRDGILLGSTN